MTARVEAHNNAVMPARSLLDVLGPPSPEAARRIVAAWMLARAESAGRRSHPRRAMEQQQEPAA